MINIVLNKIRLEALDISAALEQYDLTVLTQDYVLLNLKKNVQINVLY